MNFENCFVNGPVSPFGTIRVLRNNFADGIPVREYYPSELDSYEEEGPIIGMRPLEPDDGFLYYSPLLHQFAGNPAVIRDGAVIVSSQDKETLVAAIDTSQLFFMPLGPVKGRVHSSGYVYYPDHVCSARERFDEIAADKPPSFCDNHLYARVDPNLAGADVVELWYGFDENEQRAVFHPDGRMIPCTTDRPLAFERWGRKAPRIRYDGDGIAEFFE